MIVGLFRTLFYLKTRLFYVTPVKTVRFNENKRQKSPKSVLATVAKDYILTYLKNSKELSKKRKGVLTYL